jgi:tetratricopeptide (TPR) repeat protein
MKHARIRALAALVLFCSLGSVSAQSADASCAEILSAAAREIPEAQLGDWKDTIDSTCFLLLRRTEIWRGSVRVLVTENPVAAARLHPDATFVITSGLLDVIDGYLLDAAGSSSRKLRNIETGREVFLAPFLAFEVAKFAASTDDTLAADALAPAVLETAGFSSSSYTPWLDTLAALSAPESPYAKALAPYAARNPSPSARKAALAAFTEKNGKLAGDIRLALRCVAENVSIDDALESLSELDETWPGAWWFSRLRTIASHERWLETVPADSLILATVLPFATRGKGEIPALMNTTAQTRKAGSANSASVIPGNQDYYLAAVEAYRKSLAMHDEPGLAASYAALLARSGNATMRDQAWELAKKAAAAMPADMAVTVNFASISFLLDRDAGQALSEFETISEGLFSGQPGGAANAAGGFPGDERAIAFNAAVVLRAGGKSDRAKNLFATLPRLTAVPPKNGTPIVLRRAHIGDDADALVSAWGEPAEILYTAEAEFWEYPSASAAVALIRGDETLTVRSITLGAGSAISFGNDTRVGDDVRDFAAWAGKPAYRAGDCDVYIVDGNTISIFSLAGKIRSVRAGS